MNEESLFEEALSRSPEERAAFLAKACEAQPELRAAVEALLAAHEKTGNLLDRPAVDPGETVASEPRGLEPDAGAAARRNITPGPAAAPRPGTATADYQPISASGIVIAGRYTLQQKIGEGGMGEVWVAKQTEPVKRKVALKLIKTGMDSKAVVARFEQERQALAMMDHPNIAKVLDGGLTPSGQPFFVMELVNGLPLTKFCDEATLTLKERLELFVPICQAVQHAHHKGIVHRDLKPANILVTMIDGKPVPKVIDFGVAKATAGKLTDESLSTQFGAVVGTLEYMSPEQAGLSGEDIDTRADIYSLGVILYELLTGLRPIDANRLRQAALTELIRIIREEEPSKPSTRLSTDESLPSTAALRHIEPRKLMALLRGELDWVVMKCLEKSRERRYETANALARDVQRYLADEAVEARPPSARYRFSKFVRRHKGRVIAASLVLLSLLGGLVAVVATLAVGNVRVARQRDRAEQNLAFSRTVVDEMYTQVAEELQTNESPLPEHRLILEKALRFYQRFAVPQSRDPAVLFGAAQAGIRLGKIQNWLRQPREAEASSRDAMAILSRLTTNRPANLDYRAALAEARSQLGKSLLDLSEWEKGVEELAAAAEIYAGLFAQGNAPARGYSGLVTAAAGFFDLNGAAIEQNRNSIPVRNILALIDREFPALDRWARAHPDHLQNTLEFLRCERWVTSGRTSDSRAVEEGLIESLERTEKVLQEQPSSSKRRYRVGLSLASLGRFYGLKHDYPRSLEFRCRAIAIFEKLASERQDVSRYQERLASLYGSNSEIFMALGRYAESEEMVARAIPFFRSALRVEPLDRSGTEMFATLLGNEAETLMRHGRYQEAASYLEETLTLDSRHRDAHHLLHALNAAHMGNLEPLRRHEEMIRATLLDRAGIANMSKGFWITCFDSACIHASLVKVRVSENQGSPANRQRTARAEIERALDYLEKSHATGEFKGYHNLDQLRRDPTLDILRSEPRFQILMMDLSFPDDPFRY